jgi:mRNA-degrading endonuclease YafQ of YafQ-DinJ toxin-antitoxin module
MSFRIVYTPGYNRRAARFLKKHPDLLSQYEKALKLLELDPFHPSLHRLKGPLKELHSVSINASCRITLELIIQDQKTFPWISAAMMMSTAEFKAKRSEVLGSQMPYKHRAAKQIHTQFS